MVARFCEAVIGALYRRVPGRGVDDPEAVLEDVMDGDEDGVLDGVERVMGLANAGAAAVGLSGGVAGDMGSRVWDACVFDLDGVVDVGGLVSGVEFVGVSLVLVGVVLEGLALLAVEVEEMLVLEMLLVLI
ncbi:hypothetical protein FIBSPDRAFT_944206 [Athelia psychrophila]|uniref:Uncharacterized protein n=1 Tax=Athelia psychrophila TaxID=1759441 RepID=A0A166VGB9_9AGAM|nr:hypothetical protein FIBSPDRAFT_944206 [Fibularhizoctonia sp. CBS 109695]